MFSTILAMVCLAGTTGVLGQNFEVAPTNTRQGETLRVRAQSDAAAARMNGRTVKLFPQPEGGRLGLMPVPVEETPGQHRLDFLGRDGTVLQTVAVTVTDAHFPTQDIAIERAILELKPSPGEREKVAAFRETVSEKRYWTEPFVAPVPGCMNSPFGVMRLHNGKPTGNYHAGIDQRSPAERPVRAVSGGVIRIARMFNVHGGTVGIDHGQGLSSIYLHLSRLAVGKQAAVRQGQVIGYVGATGRATGPHLHWQIYANGVPVNPRQWVKVNPCP